MRKIILLISIFITLISLIAKSQNINPNASGFIKNDKSVPKSNFINDKTIDDWYFIFNTDDFKTNSKYYAKKYQDEVQDASQNSCNIYIDLKSVRNSLRDGNNKIVTVKEAFHDKFKDYFSERFIDYFQYDLEFNCIEGGYYYPEKGIKYFTDGTTQNNILTHFSIEKIEIIKFAPDGIYDRIYSVICK